MGAWAAAMGVGRVGVQASHPHGQVEQQGPVRVETAVGLRTQFYQTARTTPSQTGKHLDHRKLGLLLCLSTPIQNSLQSKDPQSRPDLPSEGISPIPRPRLRRSRSQLHVPLSPKPCRIH